MRVLLIEDSTRLQTAITRALSHSGYAADVAGNGQDGLLLATSNDYDVIILDLMLPDDDGLSLTASFPTITSAPIIICSARHGQIDRVLGLKLGAADFVAKPFELADLEARIEAVLRQSRRQDEQPGDELQLWRQGHRTKPRLCRDRRSASPSHSD